MRNCGREEKRLCCSKEPCRPGIGEFALTSAWAQGPLASALSAGPPLRLTKGNHHPYLLGPRRSERQSSFSRGRLPNRSIGSCCMRPTAIAEPEKPSLSQRLENRSQP